MKLGLINSVWLGTSIDPYSEGISVTKQIGFDTIDVLPVEGELSGAQLKSVKDNARQAGLPIRSIPLILFGLFDPNRSARLHSVQIGRRLVDLASLLEADNVLIVNGEYFWQLETGFTREWIWNTVVEGMHQIGQHAAAAGIRIAIELEPFRMSIVNSIDSMDAFLKAVDLPGVVMANVDCSHLFLAKTPPEEIQKLRGRIAHVHLSDAIDKHGDLPPGRGRAPLKAYLAELATAGFQDSVSIELEWPPDSSREGVIRWVTEAYEQSDKMMKELGIRP
jgi:sugar phosphate isomerase/epimerase